jgi:hypothetical protein
LPPSACAQQEIDMDAAKTAASAMVVIDRFM